MAQQTPDPILQAPPRYTGQSTEDYLNALNLWLTSFDRHNNKEFHLLRGSGLFLLGLPTSGYGLRAGYVFSNGGVLTIVAVGDIWAGGFAVEAAVGHVTVTVV